MLDSHHETANPTQAESPQDAYGVEDESENDTAATPDKHYITTYGADLTVENLCRMQESGEIIVPSFQRSFVWTLAQSSKFIESLLLDWPVPGIFLARDTGSDKLLVIDGQQRLKSLLFFRQGIFHPESDSRRAIFALTGVSQEFNGATYADLWITRKADFDNYLFHATFIGTPCPEKDDTSIYHIFERLNTGGDPLRPQEVRSALYHGKLMDTIREINQHPSWRQIYGPPDLRQKDQELILRFLAFAFPDKEYQRPLKEYLNQFAKNRQNPPDSILRQYANTFKKVSDLWWEALEHKAFRPAHGRLAHRLNAAVFDSMTVGLAQRIESPRQPHPVEIANAYQELMTDADYREAISHWTSSENAVTIRLEKATSRLAQT